ncbi:hypothetical protein QQZ08_001304 [Neonectria magnoliae]|uniref:Xylose isomerase-like TIM barrel domain-containing protein n=1 Tax=Neonectria magnoliae TaxID=2732573 RepID=A0ABR1IFD5_9HYPO
MSPPRFQNKWAISTVSLGKHPSHTLERKLVAAAKEGFKGIELVYSDVLGHAKSNGLSPIESAELIKTLCGTMQLEVLSLGPLKNFEGNLTVPLSQRLEMASEWIRVASAAGTKIMQVPSQFLSESTGDDSAIIPELQALADLAAKSGITIAYEAVAFGRFNSLWQDSLRIVQAVDRPNFGLCLDSFHIHSRIWGDPMAESGQLANSNLALKSSMAEFVEKCPRDKLLYMQLSDAIRFTPPLTPDSPLFEGLEIKSPQLAWSRSGRPFPLEDTGYFPVVDIAKTWLLDYGWQGWLSIEGFLKETESESNGPEIMAARARQSIEALYSRL